MNLSLYFGVAAVIILFLCLIVFIYFQAYKKNINKALKDTSEKHIHMIEPYKIVFVLVIFFVSLGITFTSVAGFMYSKDYFEYEKNTTENMAARTVYVDYSFENVNLHRVNSSDTERIGQIITQKYPGRNIDIIPVYTFSSGIYLENKRVNVYAIPKEFCSFLGLSEMQNDTAYFYNEEISQANFEICVTKIVENGFQSDKLEKLTFEAKSGISDKSLVSIIEKENMTPSMREDPICFVTLDSFYKMASVMLETDINSEAASDKYIGLITLKGIYICCNRLSLVNSVSSTLVQQSYNAHTPIDTFGSFEKALPNIFLVFILSSAGLVLISAVNIYLTIRTVKRIKNEDN